MKKHNPDAGRESLFLLRQQRYLYHQLRNLAQRQQQLAGTNSPELLLEVISGRRKLTEKLRQLDTKLQPIKSNWQKLSGRLKPGHKAQAAELANQVQEIVGQIRTAASPEVAQNLPLDRNWQFDEFIAETQIS